MAAQDSGFQLLTETPGPGHACKLLLVSSHGYQANPFIGSLVISLLM